MIGFQTPTRRTVIGGLALAGAVSLLPATALSSGADSIRPFRVHVPDEDIVDLKRRLAGARWPLRETAPGDSRVCPSQSSAPWWATGPTGMTGAHSRSG